MESFLKFHNIGSKVNEYLEIGMPYMILYESNNVSTNKMIAIEYTESNHYYFKPSSDEVNSYPERPLHNHDFYEFTIVLSGEITLQIENEILAFKAGDCCLCNKNIHHKEFFNSSFEVVLFMFKEEYIRELLNSDILYDTMGNPHSHNSLFHHLFIQNDKNPSYDTREYISFLVKNNFDSDNFYRIINTMILEISGNSSGKKYMMMGYLCRFISLVENKELYNIQLNHAKLTREELLMFHISTILETKKGLIENQTLVSEVNYTLDYINRVVKKHTGKTLTEYKRYFILSEAARMLLESDDKITTICENLGYYNRTYFNRAFKERYGVTPLEYRKSKSLLV